MELRDQVTQANRKGTELQSSLPRAVGAHFDKRTGRIVIELNTRLDVAFAPQNVEGLENAHPSQLEPIEISPSGHGIHFPKLDADVYIPALLEGFLGSKSWMASRLGKSGGKSRSSAKAAAAKKNGQRGGRPRKEKITATRKAPSPENDPEVLLRISVNLVRRCLNSLPADWTDAERHAWLESVRAMVMSIAGSKEQTIPIDWLRELEAKAS